MSKEFICIVCPRGCHIHVDKDMNITGNQCKRGIDYVRTEMTAPKRTLTTTVRTIFEDIPRVSVKTDKPIAKELIYQAMKEINEVLVKKRLRIGDVIIPEILDTDVNIVITKSMELEGYQ
jgi:CxxC motif-containing protein